MRRRLRDFITRLAGTRWTADRTWSVRHWLGRRLLDGLDGLTGLLDALTSD